MSMLLPRPPARQRVRETALHARCRDHRPKASHPAPKSADSTAAAKGHPAVDTAVLSIGRDAPVMALALASHRLVRLPHYDRRLRDSEPLQRAVWPPLTLRRSPDATIPVTAAAAASTSSVTGAEFSPNQLS